MTTDTLWRAVIDRDAASDGLFVYGVRSTGVYCRPTCPSRRPRPDRVEFFPTPAMAESGGYRPCRRCRPASAAATTGPTDIVRRVSAAMAARPDARWTSAALARAGGTTVTRLQRGFRRTLGISPRDYLAACRRRRFLQTLRRGGRVTDAIYEAGYGSPSRVYGDLRTPGMTPATYGRGGAGASIGWTTVTTRVGRVLVAATARGLCFVAIGHTETELVAALGREFPAADVDRQPSARLGRYTSAVTAIANGERWTDTLPLDVRATAFQWRVWRVLARIPLGETRSYGDVAASIGRKSAVRAVARACGTNPVALVVPCHRVVPADGSTGGYRWGTGIKRKLLGAP